MFERLCIVGVGLLGGAIGRTARAVGAAGRVIGVVRRPESIQESLDAGAVDSATLDLGEGVAGADGVIFAASVKQIPRLAEAAVPFMDARAAATDVGSAKGELVAAMEPLLGERFMGSHPLAGSEKRGVGHSGEVTLEGAVCVITPSDATAPAVREQWTAFWQALGMRVVTMRPAEHDSVLARTSHLPHIIAGALVGMLEESDLPLAAGGLADTTRIAGADPELWRDIILANRKEVGRALGDFTSGLRRLQDVIEAEDAEALTALLAEARERRLRLKDPRKGHPS